MKVPKSALLTLIGAMSLAPLSRSAQEPQHYHDVGEKLGTVSFATSCAPTVQSQFERGVALLYSFEYEVADAQFDYIIHSCDNPAMASLALPAARKYAASRRLHLTPCTCLRTSSRAWVFGRTTSAPT